MIETRLVRKDGVSLHYPKNIENRVHYSLPSEFQQFRNQKRFQYYFLRIGGYEACRLLEFNDSLKYYLLILSMLS